MLISDVYLEIEVVRFYGRWAETWGPHVSTSTCKAVPYIDMSQTSHAAVASLVNDHDRLAYISCWAARQGSHRTQLPSCCHAYHMPVISTTRLRRP